MSRTLSPRSAAVAALTGALVLAPIGAAVADQPSEVGTGPSTATAPYVLPVAQGVSITSLLTVGDNPSGAYPMVGIPDGLGAQRAKNGPLTVLMNHEIRDTLGVPRAHGQKGAFVSKWTLDPRTGVVQGGSDLISTVNYWQYGAPGQYGATPLAPVGAAVGTHTLAFSRFCSGYLSDPGQLYNKSTRKGYAGDLYFANEESGDEGRVFGVTMSGTAWQLPRLGLFSWENTIVAPTRGDTTVVVGNEDGGSGQLRVYWGAKQSVGTEVERAGLTNGTNHVLTIPGGVTTDAAFRTTHGTGTPVAVGFADSEWNASGAAQNASAAAAGLTLNRIEDGAFDPRNPNDYYFLTTEGGDKTVPVGAPTRDGGGLWRLSFADVNRPQLGGTLTLLLDGSEAPSLNKPDNMAIDTEGNVLIQEDPGGNAHLARILAYRIEDGAIGVLAQFDAAQFSAALAAPTAFITEDEESSGIIDISRLTNKESTFLFDAEVHKASADPALVEQGQLLTMTVDSWDRVYEARNDDSENGHDGEDQGNHGGQDDRRGYSIGLWGDMPYTATGPAALPNVINDINKQELEFTVFDGDIKAGSNAPCDQAQYDQAQAMFSVVKWATIYTPGDNEWTDCDRQSNGLYAPNERLALIRTMFFSDSKSQGQDRLDVTRQSAQFPENARWEHDGVTYITVNTPGSDNNYPQTDAAGQPIDADKKLTSVSGRPQNGDLAEYTARNAANLAWLDAGFAFAKSRGSKGIMVVQQADMFPSATNTDTITHYADEVAKLTSLTAAFNGQVALVNGDSHVFTVDNPLGLQNFTRVVTPGEVHNHWVRADVNAKDPKVFTFTQQLVPGNAP
ncbi:MAG: DUF839 domain-containing protein [Actinobacteria bacterium]|nr:DUF839 domain-containing protein [Actinomycetota bacterium]